MPETMRKPVFAAVLLFALFSCLWIVLIVSKKPTADRAIVHIALSSSGQWLAAGNTQGRITIWDRTRPGFQKQISFRHGVLNDLRFSPDGQLLAIASEDLGVYTLDESVAPKLLCSDHGNYGSVRFSPDGEDLLVVTGASFIETIDVHSGALRLKKCCSSIYGEVVFTPDGRAMANAGHWPGLWDAHSGKLLARLTSNREFLTFRPIAFDPNRHAILMGSQDGRVYVWDMTTRQRIALSPAQSTYVDTLAVTTDGLAIFAGFGSELQFWNPSTGEHRSLPAARPASNLILESDNNSIIFGTADGTIESWDVETQQRLYSISLNFGGFGYTSAR